MANSLEQLKATGTVGLSYPAKPPRCTESSGFGERKVNDSVAMLYVIVMAC